MALIKASSLEQVYQSFGKEPVGIEDLEDFYVPTFDGRGTPSITDLLARKIENQIGEGRKFHYLFTGYRGCGKSTELNQLQKQLESEYLIVKFSVWEKLDPTSLHYIELFIVMMEELFGLGRDYPAILEELSPVFLKNIQNWAESKEIVEIRNHHLEGGIATEAKVGGAAWFASFFARMSASAKTSRSFKETISQKVEPKISQLLDLGNALVREVESHLDKINRKGLVILIEDLDKIPLDRAKSLFFNYANQLTAIRANVIYTFPIPLYYSIDSNAISQYYTGTLELPMVKVNRRDGEADRVGRDQLKEIVNRRMDLSLFDEDIYLDNMIAYSGGCMRDLFNMINDAADNALGYGREKIGKKDWQRAYNKLKHDFDRTIAESFDPETNDKIPVEAYYEALTELAKSDKKDIKNTKVVLDLRQNTAILGYNETYWYDVHPIVKDLLQDKGLLET